MISAGLDISDPGMFEHGQVIFMLGKQLINHLPDLCQGQNGSSQRIMSYGAINSNRVTCQGSLDGEFFNPRTQLGEQSTFWGQCTNMDGMKTGSIDDDGYLKSVLGTLPLNLNISPPFKALII
jgi:hypothetical protein